ncbi:MAG: hypothetical protein LBL60_01535 [Mycoplasmataceae bacterium]|nr:hypothetical protein [Mycoplasmataceae bacterium]
MNIKINKIIGVLTMIFGIWLLFIPIYVGYKIFKNEPVFGIKNSRTDKIVKVIFALCACLVPGIILLCVDTDFIKNDIKIK